MSSELTGIKSPTKNVLISSDMCFLPDVHFTGGMLNIMIKCFLSFCVGKDSKGKDKPAIKFHWIITAQ